MADGSSMIIDFCVHSFFETSESIVLLVLFSDANNSTPARYANLFLVFALALVFVVFVLLLSVVFVLLLSVDTFLVYRYFWLQKGCIVYYNSAIIYTSRKFRAIGVVGYRPNLFGEI
jgi:hypothetical protein